MSSRRKAGFLDNHQTIWIDWFFLLALAVGLDFHIAFSQYSCFKSSDKVASPGECDIYKEAAEKVVKLILKKVTNGVLSDAICADLDIDGAGCCEAAGLGPEDPLADACAATIVAVAQEACKKFMDDPSKITADKIVHLMDPSC